MTEVIKIDRDTIISHLVGSDMDHIAMMSFDDLMEWLEYTLTNGFKGLKDRTDQELLVMYKNYVSEDDQAEVVIEMES